MVPIAGFQPDLLEACGHDYRHPVMQRRDQCLGASRDNAPGFHFAAIRTDPAVPEASQPEQWCFQLLDLLTVFVEPIGGQKAAVVAPGAAKGGFLGQRFSPGIDRSRPRRGIFYPTWQEPPEHVSGAAATVLMSQR